MKRLLALLIGGLGLRALLRRSRPQVATGPDPAHELRAKLAESREPEPEPEAEPAEPAAVEERRADVHARAREALDELKQ